MPPRLNIWAACRSLVLRPRQQPASAAPRSWLPATATTTLAMTPPPTRGIAGNAGLPPRPPPPGADVPPSVHSSSLSEGQDPIPNEVSGGIETVNDAALAQLQMISQGLDPFDPELDGHRFPLPAAPAEAGTHLKNRYDPLLTQVTKLLMRDGKLAKAQRDMAMILNFLRSSSPPKVNPTKPLLPGSPPPSHLPLNPVLYLSLAIDSVAPLIKMRNYAGAAGGGAALPVPVPMGLRQRRRQAFAWILETVEKKQSRGSGRGQFPARVAEEIVAVVEGRSSVWDKRQQVHKLGTASRANLNSRKLQKR